MSLSYGIQAELKLDNMNAELSASVREMLKRVDTSNHPLKNIHV